MDVVSFYTGEGAYKDFADKLGRSCERHGITPHIEQLKTTGAWSNNLNLKPPFLYRKLSELKRPIVWCDADAEIIEYPALFDAPSFDFAVYNWAADPHEHTPDQSCKRLNATSGVLYLNYAAPVLQLLYQWSQACQKSPQISDDVVLDMVWASWRGPKIRTYWLPREYNRMDLRWPHVRPVINHVYRDGAIFTGAQTLQRDPYLGTTPQSPLVLPEGQQLPPGAAGA